MLRKPFPALTIVGPLIAAMAIIAGLSSVLPSAPWQVNPLISPLKLVADRDEAGVTTVTKVGDTITYTLILTTSNASPLTTAVTDTVAGVAQVDAGSATASSGFVNVTGNTVTWSGSVATSQPVTITFRAVLSTILPPPALPLVNTATVAQAGGALSVTNQVTTTLIADYAYLPIVRGPREYFAYLPIVRR